jgi:hypothetical protein
LEIQLAETELQLEAARQEIDMLRMEREFGRREESGYVGIRDGNIGIVIGSGDSVRWESGRASEEAGGGNKQLTLSRSALRQERDLGSSIGLERDYTSPATASTSPSGFTLASSLSTSTPDAASSLPLLLDDIHDPEYLPVDTPTGPPPCCTDTADTNFLPDIPADDSLSPSSSPPTAYLFLSKPTPTPNPECQTCALRPLPSPTESTTLCSQAYMLISQQNFRQIDAGTIRLWLWQGYRRAMKRGEGCRVENGVLLSVLNFISGEL